MPTIFTFFAAGAIALNALTLGMLVLLMRKGSRAQVRALVGTHARLIVFLASFAAVALSLFVQYGAGLNPCMLCWWQRIFMYPVALVSLIAIIKNSDFSTIADFVIASSLLGAAVALYQHFLQMLPSGTLIPCDASGECAVRSVFEFNFVTLPWMAFSVFVFLALVAQSARTRT